MDTSKQPAQASLLYPLILHLPTTLSREPGSATLSTYAKNTLAAMVAAGTTDAACPIPREKHTFCLLTCARCAP